MKMVMHSISTMHCNITTEVRIAKETGYDGIELMVSKVLRYLESGHKPDEMFEVFKKYDIWPLCLNALAPIEVQDPEEKSKLMEKTEMISRAAGMWGCPTIQICPVNSLVGRPQEEIHKLTANNIREIADIGKKYGVRYQVELIAFSPIHTLKQALEVIEMVDRDNVGMVIDFWHLHAGGGSKPEEVAKLNKNIIYGVHFCDGVVYPGDRTAEDELEVRSYRPGEGEIPVQEWVDAVLATGYDGTWSPELCSPYLWEWDLWDVARACREDLEKYLKN